jgi:tetratricopeptide (TPR) repeat protein
MPSHIFTRLGLWNEAIRSNRAAEASARAYSTSQGMPAASDQRLHAMDYLTYAYLQSGRDSEAEAVLDELKKIDTIESVSQTAAYAVSAIPARVLLEQRRWKDAAQLELLPNLTALPVVAKFKWSVANVRFANAVGAARSGNAALAREQLSKLTAIEQSVIVPPGEYDWRKQVSIQRQIVEGWLALAEGRKEDAAKIMRAAADLDDATEKHPVTPGSILPAREQLGELLLELGRPADALVEYEASLKRAPKRLSGLYGAGRAAKLAGDTAKASRYFAELRDVTNDGDGQRAEVKEARAFASATATR